MKTIKICIIDNELGSAYKIWQGLQRFARSNDIKFEWRIVLCSFNARSEMQESIDYFKPKLVDVELKVCRSVKDVQGFIDSCSSEVQTYLLDLCLEGDESEKMKENELYACASMELYRKIKEGHCYIYSRFIESDIVVDWKERWKLKYNDTCPSIIERECFVENYFNEKIVKGILGL